MNVIPYELPINGLDLRSTFDPDSGCSPGIQDVRTYYNKVQKSDGRKAFTHFTPGPPPRNILQVFQEDVTKSAGLLWTQTSLWIYYVSSGLIVQSPEVFHGSAGMRFGIANAMNVVAYSQGVDNIRYWDGTVFGDLITSGQNHAAHFLVGFANHMVSARTVYSGTDHSCEIRWSNNGDPHDWSGGDSGSLQLVETSLDPITGMFLLGDRCFITKRNEIFELVATGTNDPVFVSVLRIPGTGLKASFTIATGDLFVFFFGEGKIYRWDGSTLESIGDRLGENGQFIVANQVIEASIIPDLQGCCYAPQYEYHILVPGFGSASSHEFIYDYRNERWFQDRTPYVSACGFGSPDIFSGGAAADRTQYYFQADVLGNFITRNPAVTDNLGAAFEAGIQTYDIVPSRVRGSGINKGTYIESLEWTNELLAVRFMTNPGAITDVAVSIDGGNTFPFTQTGITSNAQGKATAWFQVAYTYAVRVQFTNTTTAAWELDHVIELGWEESGANNV